VSIAITFIASKLLLGDFKAAGGTARPELWWVLSIIISCGTVAGALIPEFTKIFTSTNSRHVREVTNCSKHGGASLNILSGFVGGQLLRIMDGAGVSLLMLSPTLFAACGPVAIMPKVFDFAAPFRVRHGGLRVLGMGPVTSRGQYGR
jgi:K(+)-stimulated pyrophosphate-energized sodium pump